jgi:thymidine phosphorylase
VGVVWHAQVGEAVRPGQELATVVHRGKAVETAISKVASAFVVSDEPVPPPRLVHARL